MCFFLYYLQKNIYLLTCGSPYVPSTVQAGPIVSRVVGGAEDYLPTLAQVAATPAHS